MTAPYWDELRDKSPVSAKLNHVEKHVVAELARKIEPNVTTEQGSNTIGHWVHDVVTVHDYCASEMIEHVRFLAVVGEYCRPGELGPNDPSTAILLVHPYMFSRSANARHRGPLHARRGARTSAGVR
jgi:hypothetical protein